jgi:hypothetical protein
MATRVKLELDSETFGRLMHVAVAERRAADWQAEVILRRALGTWDESRIGYGVATSHRSQKPPVDEEAERVPA